MRFPSASLIAKMRRFMSRRAFSTTSLGNDNAVERNRSLNGSGDSRPVKPYSSIFTWIAAQSEKSSGINSGVYLGRSIVRWCPGPGDDSVGNASIHTSIQVAIHPWEYPMSE